MSLLNKPQKEWDEYLDERSRPRRFWRSRRVLWILIPAGAAVFVAIVSRFY